MKKTLIFAIPVLALSFFTPWFIYTSGESNTPPFSCESNFSLVAFWQNNKSDPVKINADLVLTFIDKENGILSATGTVEKKGNIYVLTRRLNFHTSPNMLNGMKKVTFTRESAHPADNTPDDIWQRYFIPERLGIDFYASMKMLNDNTLFVKTFSSPYSICVIQD